MVDEYKEFVIKPRDRSIYVNDGINISGDMNCFGLNVSGKLNTKETPLNSIEIGDNVQLNSSGLILNNEINVSASEILSNSELINISSNEINLDGYVWDSSGLIVNKVELSQIEFETFEYVGDVTMDNVICAEAEDSIGGLKTFTNIECNNSSAEVYNRYNYYI